MKYLLLCLILSIPSWASWTRVQHVLNAACTQGSATCNVTVSALGTGHVLICGMNSATTSQKLNSCSGGGTYVACASSECNNQTTRSSDFMYVLSSDSSAATTVTCTRNTTTSAAWACEALEYSVTAGNTAQYDKGGAASRTSANPQPGISLTLSGSNDIIIQTERTSSNFSSEGTALYNVLDFSGVAVFVEAINTTDTTAPSYTNAAAATGTVSAIAFKEITGTRTPTLPLMGVGQ